MIKIYPLTILIIRVILLACSTVKSVQALHALGGIADRVPSAQCVRTITQKDTATSVNPLVQTNTVMTEFGKCAYIAGKYAGRVTANRERYNSNDLTASHLTLPFGTICQVTNL
jgi:rare lipoprotein A (peptidoglycan hydrolase)